jgi:hypothetical protein
MPCCLLIPQPWGLLQPTCYPGDIEIATDEIAAVARAMEKHGLEPENIRV